MNRFWRRLDAGRRARSRSIPGYSCLIFGFYASALGACQKEGRVQGQEASLAPSRGLVGLRCEVEASDTTSVVESAAPGSPRDNVRRYYENRDLQAETRRFLICREVDSNYDGIIDVVRSYDEEGRRTSEVVDSNFDGHVDTWLTFSGGRVATLSVDKNGDGQADEKRFFVDGRLARIQQDTNSDGNADRFEIYRNDRLERLGVDADFDGRVDRWERDATLSDEDEDEAEAEGSVEEKESAPATRQGASKVRGAGDPTNRGK